MSGKRDTMSKSTLGFLMAFFCGLFGILGLWSCSTPEDKDDFIAAWIVGYIIWTIIVIITTIILVFGVFKLPERYS